MNAFGMGQLILVASVCVLCAQKPTGIESVRKAFEDRLAKELDESSAKARALRTNYLKGLNGLKLQLGRENNLKAAAQVVAEIDAIEGGADGSEFRAEADQRLKRLRETWEREIGALHKTQHERTAVTAKLYLKYLDAEQEKLTRAARIKEALGIEEEKARVEALPEVSVALKQNEGPPSFEFRGKWRVVWDTGWTTNREVTDERVTFQGRVAEWRLEGAEVTVTFEDGSWEKLTVDTDNPDRLVGTNSYKNVVTWTRSETKP